jgi:CheY-like chemotaxis protein
VFLVDDHRGVLNQVSALLADRFDVVGTASNGIEALDTVDEVVPDVVVLDINMPGLDGFQTIRVLRQAGSKVPVVFLSMLDTEELVGEAFRCGGQGYVVKGHAGRDLGNAIDQVLLGRLSVPSLSSLSQLANGGVGHALHLYGGTESFLDNLATFFDRALRRGDATCVIASKDLREGLGTRLRARGWHFDGSSANKRYMVADAADALKRFMRSGMPDPVLLADITAELEQYRLAVTEQATSPLTIFGNMSMLLSAAGNTNAALALEHQWDVLTRGLPFFTVCAYSTACFHEDVTDLWSKTCAEHWAVSQANDL